MRGDKIGKGFHLGQSIAFRFSLVAALLAGLAVLLVGGAYWTALVREVEARAEMALKKDAITQAEHLGGVLNAISGTFRSLSENSLFATALVDSAGKETYLQPFLAGLRRVQGIPVDVIFTDFTGQTIATNGAADLTPRERQWLSGAIAGGKSLAVVFDGEEGAAYILAAEMLIYDRTDSPEGTLSYRLKLSDINLGPQSYQPEEKFDSGPGRVRMPIPVDPIFQPLGLHVHDRLTLPSVYQETALRGFFATAVMVFLMVLVASQFAGRRMTRSLTELDLLMRSVVVDGLSDKRAKTEGDDEVSRLAGSFNIMMGALERAQEELEARVSSRTEELQQALARIDASEKRYRCLFTMARVAMLLVDPETGIIIDANTVASEFYGHGIARLKGMSISDINVLSPEDTFNEMAAAREERRNHFNFRHRLANGEIRDVEVHSGPLEIEGRTLLFSIVLDITDRRRLETERLQLVMAIEQCPASVVITDVQGTVEYVNPAFSRVTGYSRDEVVGHNPRLLQSGQTSDEEYQGIWAELTAGRAWNGTFCNRRKDGSLYWENAQISPVIESDGKITHYLGIKEDITERRLYQQKLEELLLEQKTMLENNLVGIVKVRERVIVWANPAYETMLGYESGDLVGMPTRRNYLNDEAYENFGAAAYPVLKNGEIYRAEIEQRRKDGRRIWVDLSGAILDPDAGTSLWGFVDITKRKELELDLQQSNAELEQFAYVASHDLRQPLRMISSYLGIIEKKLGSRLTDELKTYFGFVVGGARKMDLMITDLLEYSRTGKSSQVTSVPLGDSVSDAVINLTPAIRDSAANLRVADNLPAIAGDPIEFTRLFQNLLGNAIKYRSPMRTPEVEIGWRKQGHTYAHADEKDTAGRFKWPVEAD